LKRLEEFVLEFLSIPPTSIAGISIYVGVFHLLIYLQRREQRAELSFALTCFSMAIYGVLCAGLYSADSAAESLPWQRTQVSVLILSAVLFLRFISDYTSQPFRRGHRYASLVFLAAAVFALANPAELVFRENSPLIRYFELPFSFHVSFYEAAAGPLLRWFCLAGTIWWVYIFAAAIRFYRQGNQEKAKPLLLALSIFSLGLCNDLAINLGFYEFFYTIEYAYAGMVLVMGYSLSREVIEAGRAKKALHLSEDKLRRLNDELEHLVEKRTEQLKLFNKELKREIAERKKTEEALRDSEARYKQLFNHAPAGIYEVDFATGKLVSVNAVMCKYTGYSSEELLNMSGLDLLTEESKPIFLRRLLKIFAGQTVPENVEYRARAKDGREYWIMLNSKIIYQDGKPTGAFAVVHDITETKRVEQANRELETQLNNAQKMEAIGTLAGGVAHDLNNILSGIVSYPELILLDLPDDSPLRDPVMTMKKSGEKAVAIVQDLLTLARRGVASKDVVNINQIIRDYLSSHEFKQLQKYHPSIKIETCLDPKSLNLVASPVHLSKVVMNLVSNAAEAMPAGGVVTISTENQYIDRPVVGYDQVNEGDYVVLTVSDTGIGISPEDMKRIFEPFYTKKKMGRSGTGLGMAVVWGTVKDHDGYIQVKSTEGNGASFTLYFPATRQALDADLPKVPLEHYRGNGESLLVVDDVKEQREIAAKMLEILNYRVHTVASGEDAIEYLRQTPADLLVLDMIMDPGIDGCETYRRIIEIRPAQKAIIVSGFSDTERVKEAQRMGAGIYLKKPYIIGELGRAVRTELANPSHLN
jgi:two-component system cell cycle sensor histidine kinase/response regulator CckA